MSIFINCISKLIAVFYRAFPVIFPNFYFLCFLCKIANHLPDIFFQLIQFFNELWIQGIHMQHMRCGESGEREFCLNSLPSFIPPLVLSVLIIQLAIQPKNTHHFRNSDSRKDPKASFVQKSQWKKYLRVEKISNLYVCCIMTCY